MTQQRWAISLACSVHKGCGRKREVGRKGRKLTCFLKARWIFDESCHVFNTKLANEKESVQLQQCHNRG